MSVAKLAAHALYALSARLFLSSLRCEIRIEDKSFARSFRSQSASIFKTFHSVKVCFRFLTKRNPSERNIRSQSRMVAHIKDKADLESKLNDAGSKLVIIDFFATWCGPCKMISPKLEELATEFANAIVVLKVDVDECEDIAMEYNISSMPTFVFIKNKETVTQFSGANYDKLRSLLMEHK